MVLFVESCVLSQTADTSEHRFLLGALAAGHMTNDWVAGTLWILAPAIAASMGLGPTEVGLILAINGLGAGLAYIPAGIIADRSSHPGWLMMMTTAMTATTTKVKMKNMTVSLVPWGELCGARFACYPKDFRVACRLGRLRKVLTIWLL